MSDFLQMQFLKEAGWQSKAGQPGGSRVQGASPRQPVLGWPASCAHVSLSSLCGCEGLQSSATRGPQQLRESLHSKAQVNTVFGSLWPLTSQCWGACFTILPPWRGRPPPVHWPGASRDSKPKHGCRACPSPDTPPCVVMLRSSGCPAAHSGGRQAEACWSPSRAVLVRRHWSLACPLEG